MITKPPFRPKRSTIQEDRRFEDQGFSEESPMDKFLYNRSRKINPARIKPTPKGDVYPEGILARRKVLGT